MVSRIFESAVLVSYPLEAAKKPNIDRLAMESGILGRIVPTVDFRDYAEAARGHLSLFGYDPLEYEIGRGVLRKSLVLIWIWDGDHCASEFLHHKGWHRC